MRLFKLSSLAIAAILAIGFSGNALAFHDGGVAQCDGCHTMHNSYNGLTMSDPNAAAVLVGNTYLLQGSDASSTCLNCHGKGATIGTYQVDTDAAGYTGTTVPQQMTPGGDFAWLKTSLDHRRRHRRRIRSDQQARPPHSRERLRLPGCDHERRRRPRRHLRCCQPRLQQLPQPAQQPYERWQHRPPDIRSPAPTADPGYSARPLACTGSSAALAMASRMAATAPTSRSLWGPRLRSPRNLQRG